MEGMTWRSILAMAALCALETGLGGSLPARPAEPLLSGFQGVPGGKEMEFRMVAAGHGRDASGPARERSGAQGPGAAAQPGKDSVSPAKAPDTPSSQPSQDEKTDCDDCVIVQDGGNREAGMETDLGGAASTTALAGTLWGLFLVSRPRRSPRTIIRGVTVP